MLRHAAEGDKAMMPVEVLRLLVLGIDDECVDRNFRPSGTVNRIPQHGSAEFETVVAESDGQPSQTRDGNGWIARQPLRERRGQLGEENTACRQCVVPGNSAGGDFASHKAGRRATAHILTNLVEKIPVERINPAGKPCAIVAWRKGLNDERACYRDEAIKRA
jgi:hypothetical protein